MLELNPGVDSGRTAEFRFGGGTILNPDSAQRPTRSVQNHSAGSLLSTVCRSLSPCPCLPVGFGMRHRSRAATLASPLQSLLHPQNAINVQPSFILIHSPLAQMKWIRNLVGQGRACRLPSVAELFSILLASTERERENEKARKRPNDEEKWSGMQIADCRVQ